MKGRIKSGRKTCGICWMESNTLCADFFMFSIFSLFPVLVRSGLFSRSAVPSLLTFLRAASRNRISIIYFVHFSIITVVGIPCSIILLNCNAKFFIVSLCVTIICCCVVTISFSFFLTFSLKLPMTNSIFLFLFQCLINLFHF